MNDIIDHIEGTVTVEMDLKDWVWLCEVLVDMKNCAGEEGILMSDIDHALSALEAFEDAI